MRKNSEEAKLGSEVVIGENVVIERGCAIGDHVRIGHNTVLHENTYLGKNSFVGENVVLGERIMSFYKSPEEYVNPKLEIGPNSIIRSGTVLYAGSKFGEGFETGPGVVVREKSSFGKHNLLGPLCQSEGDNRIGDYNRFLNNVHLPRTTVIHNYVWVFPYTVFTNDLHPPCGRCLMGPTIEDYAIIGTHCMFLPGVKVGRNSLVGAMSLVTKDVPPETVVFGIPARVIKSIHEVKCKKDLMNNPYPWRDSISREKAKRYGYPWWKERKS